MLSIHAIGSSQAAGHYFSSADYYVKGEDKDAISSGWFGSGAEKLGLSGEVDHDVFISLLEGRVAGQFVGRIKEGGEIEHRPGWDFTLSAPKSVSVLALAGGDKRLLVAHSEAVKAAMTYAQKHVIARQMKDGVSMDINTDNIVAAQFTHTTSRSLDPQLHTHNVIMNLTYNDGKWRSIETEKMYDQSMMIGLAYRADLAERVKNLGYDIDVDSKYGTFEISDLPKDVIAQFSKRRQAIEKEAERRGVSSAKDMDAVTVATRDVKQKSHTNERIEDWDKQLSDMGHENTLQKVIEKSKTNIKQLDKDFDKQPIPDSGKTEIEENTKQLDKELDTKPATQSDKEESDEKYQITPLGQKDAINASEASRFVKLAFDIAHEREASVSVDSILKHSIAISMNEKPISPEAAMRGLSALIDEGLVVQSLAMNKAVTSPRMLRQEQYIVSLMKSGQGDSKNAGNLDASKEFLEEKGFAYLNAGQMATALRVATSKDQFVGIQGYAGVGKTSTTKAIRDLYRAAGFTVKGFAPTNGAASVLQSELGIESNTLASHMFSHADKNIKYDYSKDVWIVDESGLMSNETAADMMTLARKTGAKVIMLGDTEQLSGVEAGTPFKMLQRNGMDTAHMTTILRQKGSENLLKAVYDTISKAPDKAINRLSDNVIQPKKIGGNRVTTDQVVTSLVDDYMSLSKGEREQTLIMIPDNETRSNAMEQIRDRLVEDGVVSRRGGVTQSVLVNRQMTLTEKGHSQFYKKGDLVEFSRGFKTIGKNGVNAGDRFIVADKDKNGELILNKFDGKTNATYNEKVAWNPSKVAGKSKFGVEVYDLKSREFSQGDEVILNKTIKKMAIKNGMRGKVLSTDAKAGTITVKLRGHDEPRVFNLTEFKNLDYAYASTVHVAQGMTYKRAMFVVESWRRNVVNTKSFYVSLSRAKTEAKIYTDDRVKLQCALLEREGHKSSAHNLDKPIPRYDHTIKSKPPKIGEKIKAAVKKAFSAAKESVQQGRNKTFDHGHEL